MATCLTTIPPARIVKIYDASDLPAGTFYCVADSVEGFHGLGSAGESGAGARSRDAFQRHGIRVSIVEGGAETGRTFTHEPRAWALDYLSSHPGVQFGLLLGCELRDSETGASTVVA